MGLTYRSGLGDCGVGIDRIEPDFGHGMVEPVIHVLVGYPADEVEVVPAGFFAGGDHGLEHPFGTLRGIDGLDPRGAALELAAQFELEDRANFPRGKGVVFGHIFSSDLFTL